MIQMTIERSRISKRWDDCDESTRGHYLELADASEFRQTIEARPPRWAHASAILLSTLLAAALIWAAMTRASLVVTADGRIRPVDMPSQVYSAVASKIEGRVAEVHFDEGAVVRRGQLLIRLNTEQLDGEIQTARGTIAAGEDELAKLSELERLIDEQYAAARAKAEAELALAEQTLERSGHERAARVRQAEIEVALAKDDFERKQALAAKRAMTPTDVVEARGRLDKALEQLHEAQLPLDRGAIDVARRTVAVVDRDYAVERGQLDRDRVRRSGEVETARNELAMLNGQRAQAELIAPIDGVVTTRPIKVGDVLEQGKPAVEIARRGEFLFEAQVSAADVGLLVAGMPARIKFDAFDYQHYGALAGEVTFVSPDSRVASGAAQNAAASYLVKIALAGDAAARDKFVGQVKLGLTGRAEIITERQNLLSILTRRIGRSVRLD